MPDLASDPTGTQYFDIPTQTLHLLVRGSTPVDVLTIENVWVDFEIPSMDMDEFFGDQIVENLAK